MAKLKPPSKANSGAKSGVNKIYKNHSKSTSTFPRPSSRRKETQRFTLKQRAVNYNLMSDPRLDVEPDDAVIFFQHIFPNKTTVTAKDLLDDWNDRNRKKGTNMYNDRICKPPGSFTREEILAHQEALTQIEQAHERFNIEYDHDYSIILGPPIDGTFLHPSPTLSKLPRGTVNGQTLPLGWQRKPADGNCPTTQWYRDEASLKRKAMLFQNRAHTSATLRQVARTPSMTPVVQNGFFMPNGGATPSSPAPGPAPLRLPGTLSQFGGAQAGAVLHAQLLSGAAAINGPAGRGATSVPIRLPAIGEEDEDEDEEEDGEDDEDDEDEDDLEEDDEDVEEAADNAHDESEEEDDGANGEEFDDTDAVVDEEADAGTGGDENREELNGTETDDVREEIAHGSQAEDDILTVPDNGSDVNPDAGATGVDESHNALNGLKRLSISTPTTTTEECRRQAHPPTEPFKREPHTQAILDAIHVLLPAQRTEFFQIAFPSLRDVEAHQLTLDTHDQIQNAWFRFHTTYTSMFSFNNTLTSPDSPLSDSYTPRLRMFHKFLFQNKWGGTFYERPAVFSAISPIDQLYKRGGSAIRVWLAETESFEDIMTCNDAFCGLCAGLSGLPPTENAEQDLHDVPFVHSDAFDYANAIRREDSELWSVFFKGQADNDLGSVLPAAARYPDLCNVTFADRCQCLVSVCHPEHCQKCPMVVEGA